jgi:hypothetical protein
VYCQFVRVSRFVLVAGLTEREIGAFQAEWWFSANSVMPAKKQQAGSGFVRPKERTRNSGSESIFEEFTKA